MRKQEYNDIEPYIFISYAHHDGQRFTLFANLVSRLQKDEYRLWFDEFTPAGQNNDDFISERIEHCSVFIALISSVFCKSDYCRNELLAACEGKRNVIPVYLENCDIPKGMELRIRGIRPILYYSYNSFDDFYQVLCRSDELAACQKNKVPINESSIEYSKYSLNTLNADIQLCMSPKHYHDRIILLERDATKIRRIPKRLSVIFKSNSSVKYIAEKRYGRGNPNFDIYIDEHKQRQLFFYDGIRSGKLKVYEIYSRSELRKYFLTGVHGASVSLRYDDLKCDLDNWQKCVTSFPNNYFVALTDLSVPNKYQVVDEHTISFHEAIGATPGGNFNRYNALFIESEAAAKILNRDFDSIFYSTSPESRSIETILCFINELREGLSSWER